MTGKSLPSTDGPQSKDSTGQTPQPPNSASIEALAKRLEDLEQRRKRHDRAGSPKRRQSMRDAGKGMKIATEFVCAVLIGALIGGVIDRLFGTLPWFMLLFFFLGAVAGFKNAYGAAIGESDDRLAGYRAFNITQGKKDNRSTGAGPVKDNSFDPLADTARASGEANRDGE